MNRDRYIPVREFLDGFRQQHPELQPAAVCRYFETLSRKRAHRRLSELRAGDVLIRRLYGHHQRAWIGIVEKVEGDEATLLTDRGRKTVRLCGDGPILHWEWRRLLARVEEDHFSESAYAEDAALPAGMIATP